MALLFITEPLSRGLIEQAAMRSSSAVFDTSCRWSRPASQLFSFNLFPRVWCVASPWHAQCLAVKSHPTGNQWPVMAPLWLCCTQGFLPKLLIVVGLELTHHASFFSPLQFLNGRVRKKLEKEKDWLLQCYYHISMITLWNPAWRFYTYCNYYFLEHLFFNMFFCKKISKLF